MAQGTYSYSTKSAAKSREPTGRRRPISPWCTSKMYAPDTTRASFQTVLEGLFSEARFGPGPLVIYPSRLGRSGFSLHRAGRMTMLHRLRGRNLVTRVPLTSFYFRPLARPENILPSPAYLCPGNPHSTSTLGVGLYPLRSLATSCAVSARRTVSTEPLLPRYASPSAAWG
jgi:hypothetical protein